MSKKRLIGSVTSVKMEKTAVVSVDFVKMHPIYMKPVTNTKKFKARDDMGVELGDRVAIEECVPFSKTVTWRVVEKLKEEGK